MQARAGSAGLGRGRSATRSVSPALYVQHFVRIPVVVPDDVKRRLVTGLSGAVGGGKGGKGGKGGEDATRTIELPLPLGCLTQLRQATAKKVQILDPEP